MSVNRNVPIVYTVLADMKRDASLKVGMTAMTLGYNEVNDGLGATYYIMDNYNDAADDINIVLDDPSKKAVAIGNSNYQKDLNEIKRNIIKNADDIAILRTNTSEELNNAITPLQQAVREMNQSMTAGFDEINNNVIKNTLKIHPVGLTFGIYGNGMKYLLSTGITDIPEAGPDGIVDLPITDTATFTHFISELRNGDSVRLPIGKNAETLNFTSRISVYGQGYSLETESAPTEINLETQTVLSGTITVKSGTRISLYGIVFTENAHIVLEPGSSISLTLCSFINANPYEVTGTDVASFITTQDNTDAEVIVSNYVTVSRCYFGVPATVSGLSMTHAINLLGDVAMGSQVANNIFADGCSTDAPINIIKMQDQSSLSVIYNTFENVKPAIKASIIGSPAFTFIMDSNTYSTDEASTYPALILIKPNGELTTSYANATFVLTNTTHTDTLPVYLLISEEGDLVFTDENKPTIIVDNETVVSPVIPEPEVPVEGGETTDPVSADTNTTDAGGTE